MQGWINLQFDGYRERSRDSLSLRPRAHDFGDRLSPLLQQQPPIMSLIQRCSRDTASGGQVGLTQISRFSGRFDFFERR